MPLGQVSTLGFEEFYNIVDGRQHSSDNVHHGVNPTSGQELWGVPIASEKDLDDAVAAGKKAFPAWKDTPIEKRKEYLGMLAELYQQHKEEFTTLLCKESGKPVSAQLWPRVLLLTKM
jgi:acyl-CoA reductase-like NAD-dependent aldehyde dehydrogenase